MVSCSPPQPHRFAQGNCQLAQRLRHGADLVASDGKVGRGAQVTDRQPLHIFGQHLQRTNHAQRRHQHAERQSADDGDEQNDQRIAPGGRGSRRHRCRMGPGTLLNGSGNFTSQGAQRVHHQANLGGHQKPSGVAGGRVLHKRYAAQRQGLRLREIAFVGGQGCGLRHADHGRAHPCGQGNGLRRHRLHVADNGDHQLRLREGHAAPAHSPQVRSKAGHMGSVDRRGRLTFRQAGKGRVAGPHGVPAIPAGHQRQRRQQHQGQQGLLGNPDIPQQVEHGASGPGR